MLPYTAAYTGCAAGGAGGCAYRPRRRARARARAGLGPRATVCWCWCMVVAIGPHLYQYVACPRKGVRAKKFGVAIYRQVW